MAFAQTTISTDAGASASFLFYLDGFKRTVGLPPPHATPSYHNPTLVSLGGPGGTGGYWFEITEHSSGGGYVIDTDIELHGSAAAHGRIPPFYGEAIIGTSHEVYHVPPPTPPPLSDLTFSLPSTTAHGITVTSDPLHLFKYVDRAHALRDDDGNFIYEDGPHEACSPIQGATFYAWGNRESYTDAVATDVVSDTWTGLTMEPVRTRTSLGTGTLGAITVGLQLSAKPINQYEGTVVIAQSITYMGTACSFDGYDESSGGCRCVGSGSTLTLTIEDWASIPTNGVGFTATIFNPVTIAEDYQLLNWDATYDTDGCFDVPADDGNGTKTAGPSYTAVRTFQTNSWSDSSNVFEWEPTLNSAWATANDEDVTPVDPKCVIDEYGLDMSDFGWYWQGLGVRRKHEVSVQYPSDAVDWPSLWVAGSGDLTVEHATATPWLTSVLVATTANGAAITRTLMHDDSNFLHWLLGFDEYGAPDCYMWWVHSGPGSPNIPVGSTGYTTGCDVWCWMQYPILRLDYDSQVAANLTLTVTYATLQVTDNHLTDATRRDEIEFNWTQGQTVSATLAIAAGTGLSIYADLAAAADVNMMRVDSIEISGFIGDPAFPAGWSFVINNLALVASYPDGSTEVGKATLTATMPRPSGGLPLSYTWFRLTTDGQRAWLMPDEIVCPLGDNGIAAVRYIRTPLGIILDSMMELHTLYGHIARTEGMEVDGITDLLNPVSQVNCVNGNADYDAAFVDANNYDMLSGDLMCGDVVETMDQELTDDGNYTVVLVTPRVGKVYLASGVPGGIPIRVRKRIRGNLHGVARTGGARWGGATVFLHEKEIGEAASTAVSLGSETTDAHGRYSRDTLSGYRENREGGVSLSDDPTTVAGWYSTLNELRRWLGVTGGSAWLDACSDKETAQVMLVAQAQGASTVAGARWTIHNGWTDQGAYPAGTRPHYIRRNAVSVNDLVADDGANVSAIEQVGRQNEWQNEVALLPSAAFAADSNHRGLAVVYRSGGNYYWRTFRRSDRVEAKAPVLVGAGVDGAPDCCYVNHLWKWVVAIPATSGQVALYTHDWNDAEAVDRFTLARTFDNLSYPTMAWNQSNLFLVGRNTATAQWESRRLKLSDLSDDLAAVSIGSGSDNRGVLVADRPIGILKFMVSLGGMDVREYHSRDAGKTWSDAGSFTV